MSYCANCGQPLDTDQRVCPYCGREQPPLPVLEGRSAPSGLLTGAVWLDTAVGVIVAIGSVFFYCVGLVAPAVLYFVLRQSYPALSRGLGYGLLAVGAILLIVCAVLVVSLRQGGL